MPNSKYYLVEANLSHAKAPLDDPLMKEFVDQLDVIDALAHGSPGFIAQPTLPDEGSVYKGLTLLNVSVWEDIEGLREFTYASRHSELLDRGGEWFLQSNEPAYVLFWLPMGDVPSEEEIKRRFEYLQKHGPSACAFTFDKPFTINEMLDSLSE